MIDTSLCDPVDNITRGVWLTCATPVGNGLGMKCSAIMEPHEAAHLGRREIRKFVLSPVVHYVPYCEHRLKLALPTQMERESLDSSFILPF